MHFALGPYGLGKSHFLNCIKNIARENNYLTSEIEIDSVGNVSFNNLKYLFSEIWHNLDFYKEMDSDSFTHIFSEFIDKITITEFEQMLSSIKCDGNRLIKAYKGIMLLRNIKNFHNEIEMFDSVLLSEDEFTLEFAQNQLYELFKKENLHKNFFTQNIRGVISNLKEKAIFDFISGIYFISLVSKIYGYSGFIVLIDEFIFDCTMSRALDTKKILKMIMQYNAILKNNVKFIFAIANDPKIDANVSAVLEGCVSKKNIHRIKKITDKNKEKLGKKLDFIYKSVYGIKDETPDLEIKTILKESNEDKEDC